MILSSSAERYDFGTILDGALENLLFISYSRVGTIFDSHHPLSCKTCYGVCIESVSVAQLDRATAF
jgi:hypothetical protein